MELLSRPGQQTIPGLLCGYLISAGLFKTILKYQFFNDTNVVIDYGASS